MRNLKKSLTQSNTINKQHFKKQSWQQRKLSKKWNLVEKNCIIKKRAKKLKL